MPGHQDIGTDDVKRLLLSIHDVTPRHFERLQQIDAFFKARGIGSRYSMLVVPDFWGKWPLKDHSEFLDWLRARADEGVEMILHGYSHRDETVHSDAGTRWKAGVLTAGEGEFLGLDRGEATARINRGKTLLEDILGRKIDGFIAPAWLYSPGSRQALEDMGFGFAEDHWSVWSPRKGKTFTRGPVISYASRSRGRILSSLAWSRVATTLLAPTQIVRQAIHPHDFDVDSLVREIDRALMSYLGSRKPVQYRDLIG
jgi:predicted deacetylase